MSIVRSTRSFAIRGLLGSTARAIAARSPLLPAGTTLHPTFPALPTISTERLPVRCLQVRRALAIQGRAMMTRTVPSTLPSSQSARGGNLHPEETRFAHTTNRRHSK